MSNRERFEELLTAEMDGELSPAELLEFEAMLAADPELAAEAAAEREMIAMMAGLRDFKAPPGLVKTAVNAAMPGAIVVPITEVATPKRRLPMALTAAAACVAAVVAVGTYFVEGGRESESPASRMMADSAPESKAKQDALYLETGEKGAVTSMFFDSSGAAGPDPFVGPPSPAAAPSLIPAAPQAISEGDVYRLRQDIADSKQEKVAPARREAKEAEWSMRSLNTAERDASTPALTVDTLQSAETNELAGAAVESQLGISGDLVANQPSGSVGSGGGSSVATSQPDDLPLPDRATVAILMSTVQTELVADTWNPTTALRYMPAAATELADAATLPTHRFAIFRTLQSANADRLANDLNQRFPGAAVDFSDHVLVIYGQTAAVAGGDDGGFVSGSVPGSTGSEFYPGPAPVREIKSLDEVEGVATEYGATLASRRSDALVLTFQSSGEAGEFLTVAERLIGSGATSLWMERIELLTSGGTVTLTIPLQQ
ncbi:hypothetical protein GC173_10465 [bacterium]|nr:hypothetical protein [bacterium]